MHEVDVERIGRSVTLCGCCVEDASQCLVEQPSPLDSDMLHEWFHEISIEVDIPLRGVGIHASTATSSLIGTPSIFMPSLDDFQCLSCTPLTCHK